MKKISILVISILFALLAVNCSSAQKKEPGVLVKIVVTPSSATLQPGNFFKFTAKGYDAFETEVEINPTWTIDKNFSSFGSLNTKTGTKVTFKAIKMGDVPIVVNQGLVTTMVNVMIAPRERAFSK